MLLVFATHLATSYITCSTTKVYMSTICLVHVSEGHYYRYFTQHIPTGAACVERVFRRAGQHLILKRTRLPITLEILQSINALLTEKTHSYYNITINFGSLLLSLLRASKFTITKDTSHRSECHLLFSDIVANNRDHPQVLNTTIKQLKTDPFR